MTPIRKIPVINKYLLFSLLVLVVAGLLLTGVSLIINLRTMDGLVGGLCACFLDVWLIIFIVVSWGYVDRSLRIDKDEFVFKKGLRKEKRYALTEVEEIAWERNELGNNSLVLLLKDKTSGCVVNAEDGEKVVKRVRQYMPVSAPSSSVDTLKKNCLEIRKKRSVSIAWTLILFGVACVCAATAIIATGGKEADYFTAQDWCFFGVFMSLFALFMMGVLPMCGRIFRLIFDARVATLAWRRGRIFEDDLPFLSRRKVWVDGGFSIRFVYGQAVDGDIEKEILYIESYRFAKGDIQKKSVIIEERAKERWGQIEQNSVVCPITDLIEKEDDIFL